MALDAESHKLFVAYRMPAEIATFDTSKGDLVSHAATCGDADDVFVDGKRRRLYVTCGGGAIDVINSENRSDLGQLRTRSGARTGLFVEELDRLFVAVPARDGAPAEIHVYEPH